MDKHFLHFPVFEVYLCEDKINWIILKLVLALPKSFSNIFKFKELT